VTREAYESLVQEKQQVDEAYQGSSAKIDGLETEISTVKQETERSKRTFEREIAALNNRIITEKELKAIALAEDPKDGEVLAVGSRGTVHINLGRAHKVSAGTKFMVWRPGKGNVREDFAVVRVFKVDRTRCEARVIERKDPRPVTEGMNVSNPFYDPKGELTVYIYGEVQRPGQIRLERGMTVIQALAAGGGLTQRGTEKGIRVHRRGADGKVQISQPSMDAELENGDVVYVRESLF